MGNTKSTTRNYVSSESTSRPATPPPEAPWLISKTIDKQIKRDKEERKTEIKILLLGAGESGKSTILKQMNLIHAAGFNAEERDGFRVIIFQNVFSGMQTLLEMIASQKNRSSNDHLVVEKYASLFEEDAPSIGPGRPFPEIYYRPLKSLWATDLLKKAAKQGNVNFNLQDNIPYFFDKIGTLWDPHYIPTDHDIICCRAKTTGIVETKFKQNNLTYRMFDVGGQRSERKKWIHCFEDVTAVLFVVAISGYDQCLAEDRTANQMNEALLLFNQICNSRWFVNTSMILLLNKMDIFEKKIKYSPIANHGFSDYKGGDDCDSATNYFQDRFESLNQDPDKKIYVHFTNATDQEVLGFTMAAVSDIIVQENLRGNGMI